MTRRTTRSPYAACASARPWSSPTAWAGRSPARSPRRASASSLSRPEWSTAARSGPGRDRRAGGAQGRPRRAGRRGADRGGGRPHRPVGRRPECRRLEGRAGRQVAGSLALDGAGGGQAVAPRVVPRSRRTGHTTYVAELVAAADLAVVLHEEASVSLASLEVPATGSIVVVVGPEGGLTDEEVAPSRPPAPSAYGWPRCFVRRPLASSRSRRCSRARPAGGDRGTVRSTEMVARPPLEGGRCRWR